MGMALCRNNSVSTPKPKAPRNRTTILTKEDQATYRQGLMQIEQPVTLTEVLNCTIHQAMETVLPHLENNIVDLLILDPPYNRHKRYNGRAFNQLSAEAYQAWFVGWFVPLLRLLKSDASVYVCADWQSSAVIYPILAEHLQVRNRITWEREKGRGAKSNWKNSSEDIWFCTCSDDYYFNVDAVKMKRRVLAPYRNGEGEPKDWTETHQGKFRVTHPSNLWTDISVPFWSMPENTDHPTQKPEKLIAKLVLASSQEGNVVLDPFLGSGTTSVVSKKLGRHYIGIEIDEDYCCLAEKRLSLVEANQEIQGYAGGFFWERNTLQYQRRSS
jgi:site-specific DNA-methyltransferase (adenine-specific)